MPQEESNDEKERIPVCHPLRHGCVRLLCEDGVYFGKTKKGWFFGFKLSEIVIRLGRIIVAILTPFKSGDRDPAVVLVWGIDGILRLADSVYRGEKLRESLMKKRIFSC